MISIFCPGSVAKNLGGCSVFLMYLWKHTGFDTNSEQKAVPHGAVCVFH